MDNRVVVVAPPVEAWVDKKTKDFHLSFAVPGIDLQNMQLNLQGHEVTISGDQKSGDSKQQPDYLRNEFSIGPFERTVMLPHTIDVEKLTARYSNGTVEIVAPVKEMGPKDEGRSTGS
jgi:HSP20 family protein